jgi:hypothetical protein
MKFTILKNTDAVHVTLEKITNPTLPERGAEDSMRKMTVMITDQTSEAIGAYSAGMDSGRPRKGEEKGYNKKELCSMLLSAYCKNWRRSGPEWQAKELQELRIICIQLLPETRRKLASNIGRLKLTKQLMAAAILQRIVMTQDLKEFFDKML